jgi:oxygen-independent coproporphyrinogen-3 oxidase
VEIDTIYIGGGTPSFMPNGTIATILNAIRTNYNVLPDCEISVECNPNSIDYAKAQEWFDSGVNRVSIGLQSVKQSLLNVMGRTHTKMDFVKAVECLQAVGFKNINVDLMSALPGQTVDTWRETMEKVTALEPEHISAYSLIIEEGTPFFDAYDKHPELLPTEEEERAMYYETKTFLASKGYERYEISNYARKGYACRHNIGYWNRTEYIGFGIGAASLVGNVRFRNGEDIKAYLEHPADCREDVCALSVQEQMEEFAFLGLRMMAGIEGTVFRETFGVDMESVYGDVLSRYLQEGLLCREGERYFLSEQGLDVSNRVMADFLLS